MSSASTEPISSYQRDDMSVRARTARNKSSKRRGLPNRPDVMGPTPERLAKPDAPVRLGADTYRAPMPVERMRDRGQLDADAFLNEMMFQAAEKLVGLFEGAGLAGLVRAQDLTRVVGGGGDLGDERAAHCLKEFRTACTLMGWSVAFPHRGAGRITVAVVCEGMGVKEAAALHRPGGSSEAQRGAGFDALREGLFALPRRRHAGAHRHRGERRAGLSQYTGGKVAVGAATAANNATANFALTGGDLVASNNLADLQSVATALSNLGFGGNAAASGYVKIPTGSRTLILQWGQATPPSASSTYVPFPTAFHNACLGPPVLTASAQSNTLFSGQTYGQT